MYVWLTSGSLHELLILSVKTIVALTSIKTYINRIWVCLQYVKSLSVCVHNTYVYKGEHG